jgi:hypothetical protein
LSGATPFSLALFNHSPGSTAAGDHHQGTSMIVDQDYSLFFCFIPIVLIAVAFVYMWRA